MWLVFAGEAYNTRGGLSDLVGSYSSEEEARAAITAHLADPSLFCPWWQLVHDGVLWDEGTRRDA